MKIAIGSDHAGYQLKEKVKKHLAKRGIEAVDFGAPNEERSDYPKYGAAVAESVSEKKYKLGILVCGSGIGMSIVANKVPGIRAALARDVYSAQMAKNHNDANILVLAGRLTSAALANKIVDTWLDEKFLGDRYAARNRMVGKIERKGSCCK